MINNFTFEECKRNKEVLEMKIKNLEFAISQSKRIISESEMDPNSLSFLRRKISDSEQDLELLSLLKSRD